MVPGKQGNCCRAKPRGYDENFQEIAVNTSEKDGIEVMAIGIGAVLEDFEGDDALVKCLPELTKLTQSEEASTRADACHYLGLTGSREILSVISALADDEAEQVREIVADVLEEIGDK